MISNQLYFTQGFEDSTTNINANISHEGNKDEIVPQEIDSACIPCSIKKINEARSNYHTISGKRIMAEINENDPDDNVIPKTLAELLGKTPGKWTEKEHELYLEGLQLYGKSWTKISEFVGTRTSSQIRSHDQKYMMRCNKKGGYHKPKEKKHIFLDSSNNIKEFNNFLSKTKEGLQISPDIESYEEELKDTQIKFQNNIENHPLETQIFCVNKFKDSINKFVNIQEKQEEKPLTEEFGCQAEFKKDASISTDNFPLDNNRNNHFRMPNLMHSFYPCPISSLCRLYEYFVSIPNSSKEAYVNDIKIISSELKSSLILKLNSIDKLLQKCQGNEISLKSINSSSSSHTQQNEQPNASMKNPIPMQQTKVDSAYIAQCDRPSSFSSHHQSGFQLVKEQYRDRLASLERIKGNY